MVSNQILQEDFDALKSSFLLINQDNNVPTTMFVESYSQIVPSKTRVEIREGLYIPRPLEVARILRHLKQRFTPNGNYASLVSRIRAEIILRERPYRNTKPEDVPQSLRNIAEIGRLNNIIEFRYSEFQWRGWQIVLEALAKSQLGQPAGVVATAPTGSGKTETFMLPIITDTVEAAARGAERHFVFIYPRRALAQDQLSRVLRYVKNACNHFKMPDHRIIVGIQFTGIASSRESTLRNRNIFHNRRSFKLLDRCPWCGKRKQLIFQTQGEYSYLQCSECENRVAVSLSKNDHSSLNPNLMITTAESLDNMYMDWDFRDYIPKIDGIIFDEAHLFNQVYGAHIHHLIQRVRNIVREISRKELLLIASSATISEPADFANRLFYGNENPPSNIYSIDANQYEMNPSGIETFFFLQTDNARQTMSTMIQTVMATMHGAINDDRRAIIFASSLDTVGRLKVQFDDAEINQQLWRMRINNQDINVFQFENVSCPRTTPYICSLYDMGECWRGILGGIQCHENPILGMRSSSLETQTITGNTQGSRSLDKPVIIGTSALEVGIDDPTVQTTFHYRPPRTVFDFIQRRGRAGRKENDTAYTVMVLGQDSTDHFYLVRRHRLIAGQYSLPLNPNNPVVTRIHELLSQSRAEGFRLVSSNGSELNGTWLWLVHTLQNSSIVSSAHEALLNEVLRARSFDVKKAKLLKWINENIEALENQLADRGMFRTNRYPTLPMLVAVFDDIVAAYDSWVEEEDVTTQDTAKKLISYQHRLGDMYSAFDGRAYDRRRFTEEFDVVSQTLQRMIANIQEEQREVRDRFRETRAWYDFFFHLRKLYDQDWIFYTFSYVVKYIYQALFFLNRGFDNQTQNEIDVYVPDNYFGNITPMRVHIGDQNKRTTEPITYLESLFYPYRISYRYASDAAHTQLAPMYMLDSRSREIIGPNQVRIKPAAYGLSIADPENPDYSVRKVREIRVMELQADARQNISMCQTCFRTYDIDFDQMNCECGGDIAQGSIFVEKTYTRQGIHEQQRRINIGNSFSIVPALDTWTKVNGSQVTFTPLNGGRRIRFNAWLSPSLYFSIPTKGISWRVRAIANHVEESLHAAAHVLVKAMASVVGVREDQLAYSWQSESQEVVVWEKYEGGAGLCEIFADRLQRNPLEVYQEMVSVVACPIYLSEQKGHLWETDDELRNYLSHEFGLAPETALLKEIIDNTISESRSNTSELVCTDNDGCPVCITSITNAQDDQPSRLIAWRLIGDLIKVFEESEWKEITPEQFAPVVWVDNNAELIYVLVF
ncbi:MAG: DEAD/DEAH box helicase [Anaerolineaceae bacterium]|nr:DEAD/DEAH box helicase [Anaerolineaceae bacterium]